MGNCIKRPSAEAPKIGIDLTNSQMREIIEKKLKVQGSTLRMADRNYWAYSLDDLKNFLKTDIADKFRYMKEGFDCDDFALVVAGREREWFSKASVEKGSTFGIVWGDIRKSEDDTKERAHAVNVFVDNNQDVWLVEPQNDDIFKPTSNSTFWVVVI